MSANAPREKTLDDILEELKYQRSKKKDLWDRLGAISTFISSVVLGIAGLWFTYSYNMTQSAINDRQITQDQATKMHQARVLEMQAVEKFIPYLTKEDEKEKEIALLIITTLGSPEFATQFAKLNPSKGTQAAADRIMASAQPANQAELPQSVTARPVSSQPQTGVAQAIKKSGWVYLGHYMAEERRWETRYFEFDNTADPSTFPASVLTVKNAINVRNGMPSLVGEFQKVRDVLKPPSQVRVRSVKEWYSTGYMWAEVDYET